MQRCNERQPNERMAAAAGAFSILEGRQNIGQVDEVVHGVQYLLVLAEVECNFKCHVGAGTNKVALVISMDAPSYRNHYLTRNTATRSRRFPTALKMRNIVL